MNWRKNRFEVPVEKLENKANQRFLKNFWLRNRPKRKKFRVEEKNGSNFDVFLFSLNFRVVFFFFRAKKRLEKQTLKKRQSDGESNEEEEESPSGFTDENRQWLKPKGKKVTKEKKNERKKSSFSLVAFR